VQRQRRVRHRERLRHRQRATSAASERNPDGQPDLDHIGSIIDAQLELDERDVVQRHRIFAVRRLWHSERHARRNVDLLGHVQR
jgi:hypothetical protein